MNIVGMKVAVGIATAGRCEQLSRTLGLIARLRPLPALVIIAPADERDFDGRLPEALSDITKVVLGGRGLCIQRNLILDHASGVDLLTFFDDDFYPAADYLSHVARLFSADGELVVLTSHPELDGATGPGISHEQALAKIAEYDATPAGPDDMSQVLSYGCNMTLRLSTVRQHGLRFDEELPLYGWLEDLDFGSRLAKYGKSLKSRALRGVHLGVKRGRSPGRQLGYSQIANPMYLWRKGSLSGRYAWKQMARNVCANLIHSGRPEPWIDRRGRLLGNAIGFAEFVMGKAKPIRALRYR